MRTFRRNRHCSWLLYYALGQMERASDRRGPAPQNSRPAASAAKPIGVALYGDCLLQDQFAADRRRVVVMDVNDDQPPQGLGGHMRPRPRKLMVKALSPGPMCFRFTPPGLSCSNSLGQCPRPRSIRYSMARCLNTRLRDHWIARLRTTTRGTLLASRDRGLSWKDFGTVCIKERTNSWR
jgi:hypothetical protein